MWWCIDPDATFEKARDQVKNVCELAKPVLTVYDLQADNKNTEIDITIDQLFQLFVPSLNGEDTLGISDEWYRRAEKIIKEKWDWVSHFFDFYGGNATQTKLVKEQKPEDDPPFDSLLHDTKLKSIQNTVITELKKKPPEINNDDKSKDGGGDDDKTTTNTTAVGQKRKAPETTTAAASTGTGISAGGTSTNVAAATSSKRAKTGTSSDEESTQSEPESGLSGTSYEQEEDSDPFSYVNVVNFRTDGDDEKWEQLVTGTGDTKKDTEKLKDLLKRLSKSRSLKDKQIDNILRQRNNLKDENKLLKRQLKKHNKKLKNESTTVPTATTAKQHTNEEESGCKGDELFETSIQVEESEDPFSMWKFINLSTDGDDDKWEQLLTSDKAKLKELMKALSKDREKKIKHIVHYKTKNEILQNQSQENFKEKLQQIGLSLRNDITFGALITETRDLCAVEDGNDDSNTAKQRFDILFNSIGNMMDSVGVIIDAFDYAGFFENDENWRSTMSQLLQNKSKAELKKYLIQRKKGIISIDPHDPTEWKAEPNSKGAIGNHLSGFMEELLKYWINNEVPKVAYGNLTASIPESARDGVTNVISTNGPLGVIAGEQNPTLAGECHHENFTLKVFHSGLKQPPAEDDDDDNDDDDDDKKKDNNNDDNNPNNDNPPPGTSGNGSGGAGQSIIHQKTTKIRGIQIVIMIISKIKGKSVIRQKTKIKKTQSIRNVMEVKVFHLDLPVVAFLYLWIRTNIRWFPPYFLKALRQRKSTW